MSHITELQAQIANQQRVVNTQQGEVDRAKTADERSKAKSRLQLMETELTNLKNSLREVQSRS